MYYTFCFRNMSLSKPVNRNLRSKAKKILHNVVYTESSGFPPGLLPTNQDVIESMLYLLRPERAGRAVRSVEDAENILSYALRQQWEHCTVYTIGIKHIKEKVSKIYKDFRAHISTKTSRRNDNWKDKMVIFNADQSKLCDIYCRNDEARKAREEEVGVEMSDVEYMFLEDQRTERKQYCDSYVDRLWQRDKEKEDARQALLLKRKQNLQKAAEKERMRTKSISGDELELDDMQSTPSSAIKPSATIIKESTGDTAFIPPKPPTPKKRKLTSESIGNEKLPPVYRHVRISAKKVKPEFYRTVDKLKSKFHCTTSQAIAAVVEVGNGMFNCGWKYHTEDDDVVDLDTVPHIKRIREAGQAITVLTLSAIVDEMMKPGADNVICYHDDGSKKQGVGSYSVQGVTINGKFRALPTLPIASESRANLAALKLAILNILSVCNTRYSAKQIQESITFKITDSTSHNLEVEDIVSLELGTDHIPDQLLCHTHPVLMFTRRMIMFISGNIYIYFFSHPCLNFILCIS